MRNSLPLCRPLLLLLALLVPLPAQQGPGERIVVSGRIVDAARNPVAGAGIVGGRIDALSTDAALEEPTVRTDAQGRFSIALERPARTPDSIEVGLLVAGKGLATALLRPSPSVRPILVRNFELMMPDRRGYLDVGDVALADGVALRGRVRDLDGKPLAGVRVASEDLLDVHFHDRPPSQVFAGATTTDDQGIFTLRGVPPRGLRLRFCGNGYYAKSRAPVHANTPLQIALEPSGVVAGRLVDADGEPAAGWVEIEYAGRRNLQIARTDAAGAFALSLRHRARYRVYGRSGAQHGHTKPLAGQRAELTVPLKAPVEGGALVVSVRDADGSPVRAARAAVMWEGKDSSTVMAMLALPWLARPADADGRIGLPPPERNGIGHGKVVVWAESHARSAVQKVQWLPEEGSDGMELSVVLGPESVLRGRIEDDVTGEPVAEAWVWTLPHVAGEGFQVTAELTRLPPPPDAMRTGADGAFSIGGLPAGRHYVLAQHADRLQVGRTRVAIGAGEERQGVEVRMRAGAVLRGRFRGPVAPGWRLGLRPKVDDPVMLLAAIVGGVAPPTWQAPIAADGTAKLAGLPRTMQIPYLVIPQPPRQGPDLEIAMTPFRVDDDVVEKTFDLEEFTPSSLRGRVAIRGAEVPVGRLLVVARPGGGDLQLFPEYPGIHAPRSLVAADGSYALLLPPGPHVLEVVDVLTRVVLGRSFGVVQAVEGQPLAHDLDLAVAELAVRVVGEASRGSIGTRLRIDASTGEDPGIRIVPGGMSDRAPGLSLLDETTQLRLFVPPGKGSLDVDVEGLGPPRDPRRGRARAAEVEPFPVVHVSGSIEFDAEAGKIVPLRIGVPRGLPRIR